MRRLAASVLTIVLLSAASSLCDEHPLPLLTHHVRDVTLNGQARVVGRLPAGQNMRLVIILPLRNHAQLNGLLKDLYDPTSPSYHRWLTVDEFTESFGPTVEDYKTVTQWAAAHGFTVVGTSPNRVNLDVTGSVKSIEQALHITMGLYRHPTENRTFYAPDREPTTDLPFQLWHIAGLDNYAIPKPALVRRPANVKSNATTGSGPEASFLGSDMRAAYYCDGTCAPTALTGSGQSLGLLEYAGTDLADLDTYYTNVNQTESVPITLDSVDGTSVDCFYPDCDDTEQTIDMTQALGMAPGLAGLTEYIGSTDAALLNGMATASPLNAQLSSSWYWPPPDPNTDDPYFEEFAAQGQSFFEAAGDGGAWKTTDLWWPMESPYVICVGGTDLETSSAGGPWASESAWAYGGGGISPDKFAIPFWQTTTASSFCSECSNVYRNAPDVSANSNFTFYVCADQTTCTANLYGGTSFATPMWAGYVALTNQQAADNGSTSTLGFINPAVYDIGLSSSYDSDFHDITSGSNGYSAEVGYDLATGWGSPNGSALITGLLSTIGLPGFGLTASPATASVYQGASTTSTITSTVLNGFNSAIALSAIGQPMGVTVSFSPTSITGAGTSTMTISVGSTAATGTYNITVQGASGTLTELVTVVLTVSKAPPNYTISAAPTTVTVAQGGFGKSVITTTVSGGFNASISLSATGYPGGVNVAFKPKTIAAPGSGSSTMQIAVGKSVALGDHTITINATGGGLSKTIQVTLDVVQ